MLQLVQALKFESTASDQRSSRSTTSAVSYDDSGLADFLIARGVRNPILGNRFHWYLMVEVGMKDKVMAKMYARVVFNFMKVLEVRPASRIIQFRNSSSPHRTRVTNDAISCAGKASLSPLWPSAPRIYAHRKTRGPRK